MRCCLSYNSYFDQNVDNLESQIFDGKNAKPLKIIMEFASKLAEMFYSIEHKNQRL